MTAAVVLRRLSQGEQIQFCGWQKKRPQDNVHTSDSEICMSVSVVMRNDVVGRELNCELACKDTLLGSPGNRCETVGVLS